MWGGGMRQAGILAAGALYALRNHRHRMSEDHANAKKLAEGLASIKGVELQGEPLQTNIVRFRIKDKEAGPIVAKLKERGVLVFGTGPDFNPRCHSPGNHLVGYPHRPASICVGDSLTFFFGRKATSYPA